jgi:opacity protein-like surface antigen
MKLLRAAVLATAFAIVSGAAAAAAPAPASSFVDLFYAPQAKLELHDPSAPPPFTDIDFDGHNYGLRTLVRLGSTFGLTGEISRGKIETDISGFSFDLDTEMARLGAGLFAPNSSGVYVEWINFKTKDDTGDEDSTPGQGYHGRLAGDPSPNFHVYGDLGYVMLKDNSFKTKGWELMAGAVYDVGSNVGLFADYRTNNLKDNTDATEKFSDLRFGLRASF